MFESNPLSEAHLWKLLDIHQQERGPAQHQIDSYNHFLTDLSRLVHECGKFTIDVLPQFSPGKIDNAREEWHFQF